MTGETERAIAAAFDAQVLLGGIGDKFEAALVAIEKELSGLGLEPTLIKLVPNSHVVIWNGTALLRAEIKEKAARSCSLAQRGAILDDVREWLSNG